MHIERAPVTDQEYSVPYALDLSMYSLR